MQLVSKLLFGLTVFLLILNCQAQEQTTSPDEETKLLHEFQNFMVKYNKQYESIEELTKRLTVFKANLAESNSKNKNAKTVESAQFGPTPFSDFTPEEFKARYLSSLKVSEETKPNPSEVYLPKPRNLQSSSLPETFDWRNYGVVSSVKNQGYCGGCWAFSAAANIEGQYAIKHGYIYSFSEQQMLDCDSNNYGCQGGIMNVAFDYVKNAGGLEPYNYYPFTGTQGYCQANSNYFVAKVTGYNCLNSNNEEQLKQYLYETGPISITMNASTIMNYTGGVYDVPYSECPYAPDHGVTLVGYGVTSGGLPYWTIKNSWGSSWGENGYFRIARGSGLCGVNMWACSAIVA